MQETDSQSQEQATATKAASAPAKSRTLWGDAFKRLRKNKLAVIGVCWIIIVVVVALTADLWAKPWLGSPTASDSTTMAQTSLMAPCAEHPFGTDALGRDILVRVIYGARVSLSVGIMATAISTVIGLVMGALAGFYGVVDELEPEKDRVRVIVSMFGRETPVDLELDQVEPVQE